MNLMDHRRGRIPFAHTVCMPAKNAVFSNLMNTAIVGSGSHTAQRKPHPTAGWERRLRLLRDDIGIFRLERESV